MKYNDLSSKRGEVIERFISVENVISFIISQHYVHEVNWDFVLNFLGNEHCNFALKKNILRQIVYGEKSINKVITAIEKLNKIRNLFAHAKVAKNESGDAFFINPINPHEEQVILCQSEFYEFFKIYPDVIRELKKFANQKGINDPALLGS